MPKTITRPLKVLYVDNSFTFGGAINALVDLIGAIDRSKVEPVVISAQEESFLRANLKGTEVRYWPVELPWVHQKYHSRVMKLPGFGAGPLRHAWEKSRAAWWLVCRDIPEVYRVAAFARAEGIDLIHLNNGVNGMVPALVAGKILGLPVVAHARGPGATRGFRRHYAKLADRWISVSASVTENLAEAGVDRGKVDLVHDAIDLSVFTEVAPSTQLRDEFNIPPQAPVFAVFARIIPWKGIREFVNAAARVLHEMPSAYAMVVGDRSDGDQDYYQEVVGLAHELGISNRVLFTGFRRDVADVMRLCDVVVHTSIIPEPFGLTVIEGMATGRPVVAANAGGPTEIIQHGNTGYLVDPRDAAALSAAILHLLRNEDHAQEIGRNAAARARDHYSAERYARDVEDVYARLVCNADIDDAA